MPKAMKACSYAAVRVSDNNKYSEIYIFFGNDRSFEECWLADAAFT